MMSRAVVTFIKIATVYIIIISSILQFGECESDTLKSSQSISVGQTLISENQKFELGFFSPANSSTRFIGIWFKTIPQTILWVANREHPLSSSDESARLKLTEDGNLRILGGNQRTVWCTNVSVHLNKSIAVISDSGDLILKDSISGLVAWESFDHFCDVFLMTMHSDLNKILSSWKSEVDPSVGSFTVRLIPQSPVQWFTWHGKDIYYRSGPWNGLKFLGSAEKDVGYLEGWSIIQNIGTETVHFSVNQYDTNIIRIVKVFPGGSTKMMYWAGNKWSITWEAPRTQCDIYGTCGKFGVCNAKQSPICSCPRGFVPKSVREWSKGNWSDGCVRRTQLLCSKNMTLGKERNDGFWKLSRMKVADNYQYLPSVDSKGCPEWCLNNCLCTAYAYIYAIGCLVWKGDLVDMQEFSFSGENVFIRLDHSELVKSKRVIIIIFLVSALCFIIFFFLIAFAVHRFRIRQQKQREGISKKFDLGSSSDVQQVLHWKTILQDGLTTFDFEDIVTATDGFSHSNKVGEGGFGAVFRGMLHDGQEIAVKRLSDRSGQGINEFINEILLISKLQHRNLVKILGCSIKGEEKLIVYEYLPNGSLDTFLFDPSKKIKLDWPTRFNIIQAIARVISYLHRDSRLKVIHRDLKASNVLLDDDMNPKISDFGLARTFQATQQSENTRRVVGTYGYMSPEYALRGIFSEKSDVFSFGVLLLEIINGKKISSFDISDEPLGLIGYAWKLWNEGRELELIDESLQNLHSVDQIVRCINVGLLCVQDHPDDRPTMPTVILMLSSDMLIPQPKQPLFVPESPSDLCHPFEVNKMYTANEVTHTLFEGR